MITLQDDSSQRLRIMVDVKAATTPMMVKAIPNMDVVLGSRPFELDLSEYYEKGKGTTQSSAISGYTIETSNHEWFRWRLIVLLVRMSHIQRVVTHLLTSTP